MGYKDKQNYKPFTLFLGSFLGNDAAAVAAGLGRPGRGQVVDRIVERCLALIGGT